LAILPKNIVELGGNSEWQWPMFGIPEELILDNGKDFLSLDLEQAALELGINLNFSPPRQAFYKAQVERQFGSINKRLLAMLPGQVFKYEPEKHGLDYPHLTFDEFSKIFIQWVTTIAHNTPSKTGETPAQLWQNSISKNGFSGCGLDEGFVKLCLSKSSHKRYTIQPDGIHFNSLVYNNEWLSRYRNKILTTSTSKNPTAEFKWSASDVGLIWVYDELKHTFFPVKAKDNSSHERSLFNHKVVLREQRNRRKANQADSSYQDAILALDDTINNFTEKKGVKNLPAKARRYLHGAPKSKQTNDGNIGLFSSSNKSFSHSSHEAKTEYENNSFDEHIEDFGDDLEI
jgi:putative transposase